MSLMLYRKYRKPNGEPNTFREVKNLKESELRSIYSELYNAEIDLWKELSAEGAKINKQNAHKLKAGERVWLMGFSSYEKLYQDLDYVRYTLAPYKSALEKIDKVNRAKARETKKKSKMAEEQRIKELASSLRENLIPVEKALAESLIMRKNQDLKDGIKFFKKLKNKIKIVGNFDKSSTDKGIFQYSQFRECYGDCFKYDYDEPYGNRGNATVSKKEGIEAKIKTDSIEYAKSACDAFACKIVRRTEEVIEAGRLGTTEKITKTAYKGAVDPWSGGKVIVTTTNGEYVWNTKVILNFSKLGNPYNQWPTRLEGSNEEL